MWRPTLGDFGPRCASDFDEVNLRRSNASDRNGIVSRMTEVMIVRSGPRLLDDERRLGCRRITCVGAGTVVGCMMSGTVSTVVIF